MKSLLLVFATLSISLPSFATDFICSMNKSHDFFSGQQINTFTLKNVEGDVSSLQLSLPDQNTTSPFVLTEGDKNREAHFSNECDNLYSIKITAKGFADLISGQAKGASGDLSFESSSGVNFKAKLICRRVN